MLEQRVNSLEDSMRSMASDVHEIKDIQIRMQESQERMNKAHEEISDSLKQLIKLTVDLDNTTQMAKRAHVRIDVIEEKLNSTTTEFQVCKNTKLQKEDIKDLRDDYSTLTAQTAVNTAGIEAVKKFMWVMLTAIITGFVGLGFMQIGD